MISKTNPAYGGDLERESFHRLREDKLYLLQTVCAKTLRLLDEILREYACLGDKYPQRLESSSETNLISARRKRYYDFLRRKKTLEESNGDYPAEKQALLDYYSLNLPPDCLTPLCERYIETRKKVPLQFNSRREEIDQLTSALTTHHSGLVHDLSWKMLKYLQLDPHINLEVDELLQAGNLGLFIAIHKYDLSRGKRFSTYARWWIYQSIQRHVADSTEETLKHISLSTPINEEGDLTLEDRLTDERIPTPEEHALSTAESISKDELFPSTISKRDRQVMEFLFGFYDGKEHDRKETAIRFEVSTSCIGQIYQTSLAKMRKKLSYQKVLKRFRREL